MRITFACSQVATRGLCCGLLRIIYVARSYNQTQMNFFQETIYFASIVFCSSSVLFFFGGTDVMTSRRKNILVHMRDSGIAISKEEHDLLTLRTNYVSCNSFTFEIGIVFR